MTNILRVVSIGVLSLACVSPTHADVYGGIEVGAKGVKATAIELTLTDKSYDIRVLFSGSQNTTLTSGLAATESFQPDAVKATTLAVAKFASTMEKEYRVPRERIFVVGSSGLFSAIEGKDEKIQANKDRLAKAVQDETNLLMAFISAATEAELSIVGIIPRGHEADSLLLDIGSGNTKGGYWDGEKKTVLASVPFGSVTFRDRAGKDLKGEPMAERLVKLRQEVLLPALEKAIEGKPGFRERKRVYLSGGAVWAFATIVRPTDRSSFVKLTAEDLDAYRRFLLKSPDAFPVISLDGIDDPKVRTEAQVELKRVKDTFTLEQLLAGEEILRALFEANQFGEREVLFARHGYLGWILAYASQRATRTP